MNQEFTSGRFNKGCVKRFTVIRLRIGKVGEFLVGKLAETQACHVFCVRFALYKRSVWVCRKGQELFTAISKKNYRVGV